MKNLSVHGSEEANVSHFIGRENMNVGSHAYERGESHHSTSSLSTLGELSCDANNEACEVIPKGCEITDLKSKVVPTHIENSLMKKRETVAATTFVKDRFMTQGQEMANALTVIPNMIFSAYFLLAGKWITFEAVTTASMRITENIISEKCWSSSIFPYLYVMPPLPTLFIATGIILHTPFSFMYHWKCAMNHIPPGHPRIDHISRRLDHSFIHISSAFISYGTSGRWDFFMINLLYNIECVYLQFRPLINPKRNTTRIGISIFLYSLPILFSGEIITFLQCSLIFLLALWLFTKYPIKGWSHAAFHVVLWAIMPIYLNFSINIPASEIQVAKAAQCAVLSGMER